MRSWYGKEMRTVRSRSCLRARRGGVSGKGVEGRILQDGIKGMCW